MRTFARRIRGERPRGGWRQAASHRARELRYLSGRDMPLPPN